jgi:hypothetical protein
LVESYQGKHDIITGYQSLKLEDYKNVEQLISYFKALDSEIEKDRKKPFRNPNESESHEVASLRQQMVGVRRWVWSRLQ